MASKRLNHREREIQRLCKIALWTLRRLSRRLRKYGRRVSADMTEHDNSAIALADFLTTLTEADGFLSTFAREAPAPAVVLSSEPQSGTVLREIVAPNAAISSTTEKGVAALALTQVA